MDILKKNYFDLFNIKVGVEINVSSLNEQYISLQQKFHPDKFVNATNHEKRLAMQISSYINDAYTTLGDLVKRIEYILKINNFNKDESITLKNNDFLLEQIKYNEFIEDINNKDKNEIESYKDDITKKVSQSIKNIKQSFSDHDFEKIWDNLSKLKFYVKHINEITDLLGNK